MAPALKQENSEQTNGIHAVDEGMKYPDYYPYAGEELFEDHKPFEFHDPALRADANLPVFKADGVKLENYTPKMGTKITGLQLAELDSAGLDQLGLLVAQRGFVVFASSENMKQNYIDAGIERQLEIGRRFRHFGVLHKHPFLPRPPATTEMTVVYQDRKNEYRRAFYSGRNSLVQWHHDQSPEPQPPGVSFFACLECAPQGGDTVFANCVEAYERLSPKFKELCLGLRSIHSSISDLNTNARIKSTTRRELMETSHPAVIEHPVTKQKALFVDAARTTHFEGLAKEESQCLLHFINNHIAFGQDFQARVKWEPGCVAVWDQRHIMHTALMDTDPAERRHFFRVTPLANVPIPAV